MHWRCNDIPIAPAKTNETGGENGGEKNWLVEIVMVKSERNSLRGQLVLCFAVQTS